MPEDMELSEFDEKILGMADYMSPEQISKKLGGAVSAAKIRLQLQRLLEDVDWITEAQRENLLFRRMHMILAKLEAIPGSQWDLDNLKVQLATLKELQEDYGLADLFDLLEVIAVDAHNQAIADANRQ